MKYISNYFPKNFTLNKYRYFAIAVLSVLLFACTENKKPLVETVKKDVPYGTHAQEVYDIYLPANRSSESTKVIILIHGGGWTGGDKSSMEGYIEYIQAAHPDLAIVNMNYVLSTTAVPAFPNQFLDIDAVINQLTEKKEDLQIMPEFALVGVSAGAHLSLQYDYVFDSDNQVKMVCSIVGPTNFTDPYYQTYIPNFDLILSAITDESAYPASTNFPVKLSPAFNVSSASCPTIMFYGNQDSLVPATNAYTLDSVLNAVNVAHSLTIYQGGHGTWSVQDYLDLTVQLNAYIAEHLKK